MSAVAEGPLSKVTAHYEGAIAEQDTRLLTLAATKGLVESGSDEGVNFVNAPTLASGRGLQLAEARERRSLDYTNLITLQHHRQAGGADRGRHRLQARRTGCGW